MASDGPSDGPSDGEFETAQLAEIETGLAELSEHVNTWINDRFLNADSATGLTLVDVNGLIVWLHQWHDHFDTYAASAASLASSGRPALEDRLAQIRVQIDASIASFSEMAATLPEDPPR